MPTITVAREATRISLAGITGIKELATKSGQSFTAGRDAAGRFAGWDRLAVRITARGHWYRSDDPRDDFHNDTLCRGCGHHGHFDYILDYRPCTTPATAADVARALGLEYPPT